MKTKDPKQLKASPPKLKERKGAQPVVSAAGVSALRGVSSGAQNRVKPPKKTKAAVISAAGITGLTGGGRGKSGDPDDDVWGNSKANASLVRWMVSRLIRRS